MKICSTLLIIREMRVKITRYHLTLVKMAIIKSLQIINAREGVQEPSSPIAGNVCWYSHYGEEYLLLFNHSDVSDSANTWTSAH